MVMGFVLCLALHGQTDTVRILLSRGSYQCDDRDSCGTTPLMDALRAGFVDVAKLLIQQHVRTLCHCCVKLIMTVLNIVHRDIFCHWQEF